MRDSIDILDRKITEERYDDEILSKGKVIESIYALNYLKVFDSDIFDEILRINSIEEYIINLQSDFSRLTVPAENEDSVEYIASLVKKEYINDVFKDIRAKNRFNEEQLKCEKINMMIINDIFIDNKSDVIKLTPNMGIDDIITSMDKIPGDDSQIKSLIRLQNIIISKDDDRIKQAKELQEFINKAIILYESKEVEWTTLFELMNKRHVKTTENMEMYLDSIINYIDNNNIEIKEMDKNKMLVELRDAENDVVHKYKSTFINLVLICKIDILTLNFDELNKEFSSIMDSDRLLKLLISKFELQGRGVDNFNKLYNEIEELLKKSNYGDIATDNLLSEVKNFIRLNDKIKLLKTHKITTKTQDRYEYLLSLWNLSEFKDLKKLIYDINGEQSISEDMIGCFSKAII